MVGHKAALPPTPASTLTLTPAHLICSSHLLPSAGVACTSLDEMRLALFGIELPKESSSPPLQRLHFYGHLLGPAVIQLQLPISAWRLLARLLGMTCNPKAPTLQPHHHASPQPSQ